MYADTLIVLEFLELPERQVLDLYTMPPMRRLYETKDSYQVVRMYLIRFSLTLLIWTALIIPINKLHS